MFIDLLLNNEKIASISNLEIDSSRGIKFSCNPPIYQSDLDYEISDECGGLVKIIISNLQIVNGKCIIEAFIQKNKL